MSLPALSRHRIPTSSNLWSRRSPPGHRKSRIFTLKVANVRAEAGNLRPAVVGPNSQWFPSPRLNPSHRRVNGPDLHLWNIQSVGTVWRTPFPTFRLNIGGLDLWQKFQQFFLLSQEGAGQQTSRTTGHLCGARPTFTLGASWSCKRRRRRHSETGKLFASDVRSGVYAISYRWKLVFCSGNIPDVVCASAGNRSGGV